MGRDERRWITASTIGISPLDGHDDLSGKPTKQNYPEIGIFISGEPTRT